MAVGRRRYFDQAQHLALHLGRVHLAYHRRVGRLVDVVHYRTGGVGTQQQVLAESTDERSEGVRRQTDLAFRVELFRGFYLRSV